MNLKEVLSHYVFKSGVRQRNGTAKKEEKSPRFGENKQMMSHNSLSPPSPVEDLHFVSGIVR